MMRFICTVNLRVSECHIQFRKDSDALKGIYESLKAYAYDCELGDGIQALVQPRPRSALSAFVNETADEHNPNTQKSPLEKEFLD
jgi:hypothetical protein